MALHKRNVRLVSWSARVFDTGENVQTILTPLRGCVGVSGVPPVPRTAMAGYGSACVRAGFLRDVSRDCSKHMKLGGWRSIELALVVAAICSLIAFWLAEIWLLKTSPKSSNEALGAIYPANWHGTTVYVTAVQQFETDALFWGGPLLLIAALLVSLGRNVFSE